VIFKVDFTSGVHKSQSPALRGSKILYVLLYSAVHNTGYFFQSPFWYLQFWGGSHIFSTFVYPCCTLHYAWKSTFRLYECANKMLNYRSYGSDSIYVAQMLLEV